MPDRISADQIETAARALYKRWGEEERGPWEGQDFPRCQKYREAARAAFLAAGFELDPFAIDYWQVGAALCRALDDLDEYVDVEHVLIVLDKRLDEVYPNLGWRNVMTDNWPLDPSRQRRYLPELKEEPDA